MSSGLQLIFLIGRYPFRSGVFNVMYYTIVKRLLKYVMAMLIMVLFFAFAFMILHFNRMKDSVC